MFNAKFPDKLFLMNIQKPLFLKVVPLSEDEEQVFEIVYFQFASA